MATLINTIVNDTGFLKLPTGSSPQRPGSPTVGMIRYNTDLGYVESYNGSAWVELIDNYQNGDSPNTGQTTTPGSSYRVTYFTNTGSSTFTVPTGVTRVQVLVVAGGGSGGHQVGGGGGAGGMIEVAGYPVTPGGTVPVVVGAGGDAPNFQPSNNVSNPGGYSQFGNIYVVGGGGGGNHIGTRSGPGDSGGSGGGGGGGPGGNGQGATSGLNNYYTPGTAVPVNGGISYGFPGGTGHPGGNWSGGGGGGAGRRGNHAGPDRGGHGGWGRISYITGEAKWYAGGGGGGSESPGGPHWGRGGVGGGGRGSNNDGGKSVYPDMSGVRNTGGGGGGTRDHPSGAGAGGPGVVIVRY